VLDFSELQYPVLFAFRFEPPYRTYRDWYNKRKQSTAWWHYFDFGLFTTHRVLPAVFEYARAKRYNLNPFESLKVIYKLHFFLVVFPAGILQAPYYNKKFPK